MLHLSDTQINIDTLTLMSKSLYEILEVSPNASLAVIKAVYLVHRYNPDNIQHEADGDDSVIDAVNAAYEILSDPDKRAAYDAERKRSEATSNRAKPEKTKVAEPTPSLAPPTPVAVVATTAPSWLEKLRDSEHYSNWQDLLYTLRARGIGRIVAGSGIVVLFVVGFLFMLASYDQREDPARPLSAKPFAAPSLRSPAQAETPAATGTASLFTQEADSLARRQDWNGLLNLSQQWTRVEASNPAAWSYVAMAYNRLGQHGNAGSAYAQAFSLSGGAGVIADDLTRGLKQMADASVKLKQYTDAKALYRIAYYLQPDNPEWQQGLATTERLMRTPQAAAAPTNPSPGAYAYVGKGGVASYGGAGKVVLSRQLERDAAVAKTVRDAEARHDASDPESWGNLGLVYYEAGRYQDAADAFERAARLGPRSVARWRSYGLALARSGLATTSKTQEIYRHLFDIDSGEARRFMDTINQYCTTNDPQNPDSFLRCQF